MVISILQAVIVIVILAVMIVILIGINHMSNGDFTTEESDIEQLRKDVNENDDVITDQNMFTELVNVRVESQSRRNRKAD